jgi:hypothetical protein
MTQSLSGIKRRSGWANFSPCANAGKRIKPNLGREATAASALLADGRHHSYRGAFFAKMRCSVRLCMLSLRAVSETFRPQSS